MPPLDLKPGVFPLFEIHRILRLVNRRRRLNRSPEQDGHPVGNPAVQPSIMIGLGRYTIIFHPEGIIRLTAPQARESKPQPELHALHCGDAEQQLGKLALHRAEKRFAHSGWQGYHCGFQHTAQRIWVPTRIP